MNKKLEEYVLWSNYYEDIVEMCNYIQHDYPESNEDELYEYYCDENNFNYDMLCTKLNIQLSTKIVVIGELGLWNGKVTGYKTIDSGNIRDCLYSECDYAKWYIDTLGDLRCNASHHDGNNYYLYRALKEGLSDKQIENFYDKLWNGMVRRNDINRYTYRLGDRIAKVFGFKIRKNRRDKAA